MHVIHIYMKQNIHIHKIKIHPLKRAGVEDYFALVIVVVFIACLGFETGSSHRPDKPETRDAFES